MNDNKEIRPSGTDTKPREPLAETATQALPTEKELNCRALLLCLKPFVVFFNLVKD